MSNDIKEKDDEDIDIDTVKEYPDIFDRMFLTDNQPPFFGGGRSSVRVKQAVKCHFADPSLVCALLKCTPSALLGDLETLGFLFEALCVLCGMANAAYQRPYDVFAVPITALKN